MEGATGCASRQDAWATPPSLHPQDPPSITPSLPPYLGTQLSSSSWNLQDHLVLKRISTQGPFPVTAASNHLQGPLVPWTFVQVSMVTTKGHEVEVDRLTAQSIAPVCTTCLHNHPANRPIERATAVSSFITIQRPLIYRLMCSISGYKNRMRGQPIFRDTQAKRSEHLLASRLDPITSLMHQPTPYQTFGSLSQNHFPHLQVT
jgi:hypothetical protein